MPVYCSWPAKSGPETSCKAIQNAIACEQRYIDYCKAACGASYQGSFRDTVMSLCDGCNFTESTWYDYTCDANPPGTCPSWCCDASQSPGRLVFDFSSLCTSVGRTQNCGMKTQPPQSPKYTDLKAACTAPGNETCIEVSIWMNTGMPPDGGYFTPQRCCVAVTATATPDATGTETPLATPTLTATTTPSSGICAYAATQTLTIEANGCGDNRLLQITIGYSYSFFVATAAVSLAFPFLSLTEATTFTPRAKRREIRNVPVHVCASSWLTETDLA